MASKHPQALQSFIKGTIATEEQLKKIVHDMAQAIKKDYGLMLSHESPLILISILKGSYIFTSDLARELSTLNVPNVVEFIAVSRYNETNKKLNDEKNESGTVDDGGEVRIMADLRTPIQGKHVLVVEDVVGRGETLQFIRNMLSTRQPRSLRFASLVDKPFMRSKPLSLDYCGMKLKEKHNLVGYGMDSHELMRGYPEIVEIDDSVLRSKL